MNKTRIYIVCLFCWLSIPLAAQLRFQMAERWEYRLQELNDRFTTRDVDGSTDHFQGLHTGQYSGTHHLFGLSAEGGWSSHLTTMPNVRNTPGGGSIGLHLLYEYQYSGLLVQTGLGVVYQQCANAIGDTSIYHEHMHDAWQGINDVEFTLRHDFYDRVDRSQNLYGQVPIYVGGYIIGGILGQGGFGITYIGFDNTLECRVAIKEFFPNGMVNRNNTVNNQVLGNTSSRNQEYNFENSKNSFLKEARILAKFSNEPNIVNVKDFFEENNTVYIVMEYLDGVSLKKYLDGGKKISVYRRNPECARF